MCTLFQKRARSIRSTRQLGWRENLRILRLAFYRRYVLIGRPTEFIDGALHRVGQIHRSARFQRCFTIRFPGSRQLTISTCVRHVAKASNVRVLQRTCERRTTAQAASSSPTWEVDQIGSRRVSRDESSAEVWEFSGGPERKFRRSAVWLREATLRSGCRHARRPSSSSTPSKGAREALRRCPRAWTTTTRCSGWFSRPGASRATRRRRQRTPLATRALESLTAIATRRDARARRTRHRETRAASRGSRCTRRERRLARGSARSRSLHRSHRLAIVHPPRSDRRRAFSSFPPPHPIADLSTGR